jgi:hypothetical protein
MLENITPEEYELIQKNRAIEKIWVPIRALREEFWAIEKRKKEIVREETTLLSEISKLESDSGS